MNSELIFVGNELMLGKIINTNGVYLAGKLTDLGLAPMYQTVVGNNKDKLKEIFNSALNRSEIIIVSGGMGISREDITKESISEILGVDLVENEISCKKLQDCFEVIERKATDSEIKKTYIPSGSKLLVNNKGIAQGIFLEKDNKKIFLLPGSPADLQAMFEADVSQILSKYVQKKKEDIYYSQIVKICGKSESDVVAIISDLFERNDNIKISTFTKCYEVHIIITANTDEEKNAKKLVKNIIKDIKTRLGDSVYTTHDDVTLEHAVVDLLLANDLTVTTVESCTGGMVAARLINVPGVSEVFKMGHITYSNKAKRKLLGVKRSTLDKHGAVSSQVVKEMAKGAATFTRADVAVAVSGIAGPDGGTDEKPVGLVYIGISVCGQVTTQEYRFTGDREKIRESAVTESLILMRKCIMAYYSKVEFNGK